MRFLRCEEDDFRNDVRYRRIPPTIMGSLFMYVENGVIPGGFLQNVLCNKLMESFQTADALSYTALHNIAAWLYNEAPSICWGSEEKVSHWLKTKALLETETIDSEVINEPI